MTEPRRQIRALFDEETITVYQAYNPQIAIPAAKNQTFASPFSFNRMTWIKPSFLWMMERSNWGQKSGQEHILAIRIKRSAWEKALSLAVLTSYQSHVYKSHDDWRAQMDASVVHVQWDPERSLRGATLPFESIQVGISRHLIGEYVESWIVSITDQTPLVKKIYEQVAAGHADKTAAKLPQERLYTVAPEIMKRLGM